MKESLLSSIVTLCFGIVLILSSCGGGGNILHSLDPNLAPVSELVGSWYVYEENIKASTCDKVSDDVGKTAFFIQITESDCELQGPDKELYTSDSGCRASGNRVAIYLAASVTQGSCTLNASEEFSLTLNDRAELHGNFEVTANLSGNCTSSKVSSCSASGAAVGYRQRTTFAGDPTFGDADGDGIRDDEDNCPYRANADQFDADGDGIGNACERDVDGDGIEDTYDNCRYDQNTDQADDDSDGIGNICEADGDNDGIEDDLDNCPSQSNPDQSDDDGDGVGNTCDSDLDDDGIEDDHDNCPNAINPNQVDLDRDGIGDTCDSDRDGDGIANDVDLCPDEVGHACVTLSGSDPFCELLCGGFRSSCPSDCEGRYHNPHSFFPFP